MGELHRRLENNNEGDPDQEDMRILKRLLQDDIISAAIIGKSYGSEDWTSLATAMEKLYPRTHFLRPRKKPGQSLLTLIKTLRNKMAHRNSGAHILSLAFDKAFPGMINLFTNLLALAIEEDDPLVIAGEIDKRKSLCEISCISELKKSVIPSDMNSYLRSNIIEFMQELMNNSR